MQTNGFLKPRIIDVQGIAPNHAKVVMEPFERGYGHTLGNALRRVLLSSMPGFAATEVQIAGVLHEYSTIEGVQEDVVDILLNLKGVVLKLHNREEALLNLKKKGEGPVTAGDIEATHDIEIINPEHVIATMTDDVPFVVEFTVENGRGYRTAEENVGHEREIGTIPVDSSFSPVVRVKYEIEETRVGQKTNYDRLVIEIWTNGTLGPHMALVEGAKILRKHLNPFIQYAEPGPEMSLDERAEAAAAGDSIDHELERKLNMSLAELELSVRATNCLESEGITTVRDLVIRTDEELLEVRNFGETTLREVKQTLTERGLTLGTKVPVRR